MRPIFLAGISCLLACWGVSVSAAIVTEEITYKDATGAPLKGFVTYDNQWKEPHPGVLVIHDWRGISDYTHRRAEMLVGLGYVAFGADIYGAPGKLNGVPEWSAASGKYKKDRPLFRARAKAAYEAMAQLPQVDKTKIAAIGYCFGGTGVVEMAREGLPVLGVVSFHGDLDSQPLSPGAKYQAKVLALCGADDPFQKPENLTAFEAQLKEENVDYEIVKYGNAVHSFTDPEVDQLNLPGAKYNAEADARSWETMVAFLREIFR